MIYIDPQGNYPRFIGDIQQEVPAWNQGDDLPSGWLEVFQSDIPEYNQMTHRVYEGDPVEINGKLYQNWIVREATQEELDIVNAPNTIKQKLVSLGFNDAEIAILLASPRLPL